MLSKKLIGLILYHFSNVSALPVLSVARQTVVPPPLDVAGSQVLTKAINEIALSAEQEIRNGLFNFGIHGRTL